MSLFLIGGSGLGKTELARTIHKYLCKETPLAKINFANYSSEGSLASLIGSPPGYRDSGDESDLIKKIKESSAGVYLSMNSKRPLQVFIISSYSYWKKVSLTML